MHERLMSLTEANAVSPSLSEGLLGAWLDMARNAKEVTEKLTLLRSRSAPKTRTAAT